MIYEINENLSPAVQKALAGIVAPHNAVLESLDNELAKAQKMMKAADAAFIAKIKEIYDAVTNYAESDEVDEIEYDAIIDNLGDDISELVSDWCYSRGTGTLSFGNPVAAKLP